jgi:hypothetical protein
MKILIIISSIKIILCMKIKIIHKISITSIIKMMVKVVHLMVSINKLIAIITFLRAYRIRDNLETCIT